jgi:RNA polymerase sigma-70 factor (ECF subfamily)
MDENLIVERCKQKDINAFKMIYQTYEQPLLRTALRMLNDLQDARDAVQTTFLKLYRGIKNFSFKSQFKTYLFRILINTSYDMLRRQQKSRTLPVSDLNTADSPDPELSLSLEQAINRLPQKMKACFVLFALEGFSQKEIAGVLALSIGGVKSNIYQAKCRLRKILSHSSREVV